MQQITLKSAHNEADDSIEVTATLPNDEFLCEFAIHTSSVYIASDVDLTEKLSVINNADFLSRAMRALYDATDEDTDIPMCVDTTFQI